MHSRLRGARKTRLAGLVLTGVLLAASAGAPMVGFTAEQKGLTQ